MSETFNPHQEAIKQIPTMTLEDLRKTIEAHAKPVEANDQQKQAERKEMHDALQKRFEQLKQSTSVDGSLDALEQRIQSMKQVSNAPAQAPSSVAVTPSTPTTPPNIMEKMQFQATEFATNILEKLPLPAGLKNQFFEFIAGLNNVTVPLIGKITIPGADFLGDIGELTNVREQMTTFVKQHPTFILDADIDATVWKTYKEHRKQNANKHIEVLLNDFALQSKNISVGNKKIPLNLRVLLQPKQVLEPMKAEAEKALEQSILKAWGVQKVEWKDSGEPSIRNGTLTVRKTDMQMNGEPVPNSEAMELRTLMSKFGNVDIILSTDPAITISWNGEKKAITLPKGTKNSMLETLQEILRQNKNSKFSNIVLKNNDKLGDDVATLSYSKEGVGTLTAPMNERMAKALTQFPSLQPQNGEDTKWKLIGDTLKPVTEGVSVKKDDAPKVS